MNSKTFLYIFAGVIAAGVICLGVGLAVHFSVSGNPVVTIVSLFASIAGGIMTGIGLISLLICLLFMVFGKGNKNRVAEAEASEEAAEEAVSSAGENGEAAAENQDGGTDSDGTDY